jgi:hypothetical protein
VVFVGKIVMLTFSDTEEKAVEKAMVSEKPGSMFGIIQRLALKMWLQIRRMPC